MRFLSNELYHLRFISLFHSILVYYVYVSPSRLTACEKIILKHSPSDVKADNSVLLCRTLTNEEFAKFE